MKLRFATLLAILCTAPFLNLGGRVLWPPDEGRYAEIVREMVASGDYVVPTWVGKPNIDKPPLFMWAGALSSRALGGVSETSVRIPSAVAAAFFILATFFIGWRLFDPLTGFLGALILATCGRYLLYSQWCATDMMLASCTTLALAAIVGGGGAPARENSPPSLARAGLLFMFFCALAVLTKGPVGLALPVGIVLADLVVAHGRSPRDLLAGARRLVGPWAAGALLFAAIVAPWFILLHSRLGAAGLREILFHQNVSRFLDAWNAQQPWYFYFKVFPLDFLPWSFFLPLTLVSAARFDEAGRRSWRFLRVWFVLVFAFFSTASGKSPEYLMPLLPAVALMVGRVFAIAGQEGRAETIRVGRRGLLFAAGSIALCALLGAGGVAARGSDVLPGAHSAIVASILLVMAGAVCCLVFLKRGQPSAAVVFLAASILALRATTVGALVDAGNSLNNAPEVGRALATLLPPGSKVGVGSKGADYIVYYASLPITPLGRADRVVEFLEQGPPNAVVLKGKEFSELSDRLAPIAEVVGRYGDAARGFVVLKARSH